MPTRRPKFNFVIICDDIRTEVGNKISMMGVYQKDIFVPRFPYIFPKLCFVINYENIKGGDTFLIKFIGQSLMSMTLSLSRKIKLTFELILIQMKTKHV